MVRQTLVEYSNSIILGYQLLLSHYYNDDEDAHLRNRVWRSY